MILVFAVSLKQQPLYSSNQNTYFVHGLVQSGNISLSSDWFAQTTDPFPAFSILVKLTVQLLGENAFYFYYLIFAGLYIFCLWGIVSSITNITKGKTTSLLFYLGLLWLYSGSLNELSMQIPGLRSLPPLFSPNGLFIAGFADQYILGPILQPSIFGIFILLSIHLFLQKKTYWAVFTLALAPTFHPSYLLSAAAITFSYMFIIMKSEKSFQKALATGSLALILVLPVMVYSGDYFGPTSHEITSQAQNILVEFRIPHHAKVTSWFDITSIIQLLVILLSLFLTRSTKVFPILFIPFVLGAVLTIIQLITQNNSLALLFPWRISAFLVPIGSAIILATLISFIARQLHTSLHKWIPLLRGLASTTIAIIALVGIVHYAELTHQPGAGHNCTTSFVTDTFLPGNLYLIPPDWDTFRLTTRVPIFVDFKSHPYKDTEVIEWYNRLRVAETIFSQEQTDDCHLLKEVMMNYSITHVIFPQTTSVECPFLSEIYADHDYRIFIFR